MADNILITGFGPFDKHNINASWEAVKLLPEYLNGVNIIKKEIPVMYNYVEDYVPELWKTFNPILVLHVGVSSYTDKITIEKCAFRKGYIRRDCSGMVKSTEEVCSVGEDCINTGIDIDEIRKSLNNKQIEACISDKAGRYLCEFIFYISLSIDRSKTLFVHVPPLDKPYTKEQLAEGLLDILNSAIQQLNANACR